MMDSWQSQGGQGGEGDTGGGNSFSWWLYLFLNCWFMTEIMFYIYFHFYLVPRANVRTPPIPFRDYGRDRHKLLLRILHRIDDMCRKTQRNERQFITKFLLECFHPIDIIDQNQNDHSSKNSNSQPPLTKASSSISSSVTASETNSLGGNEDDTSPDASDAGTKTTNTNTATTKEQRELWTVPGICRNDADEFFSWAFFGRHRKDLVPWEVLELQVCFDEIQKRLGLTFSPGSGWKLEPRRLTLEDVNPLHRPLSVYLAVSAVQLAVGLFLRTLGYQRIISKKTGVTGWYKPARDASTKKLLPLVFFHGIAPGGLVLYLPMVLLGLATDGRAVFMFDNKSISCCIDFQPLTEEATVEGVTELINLCLDDPDSTRELSLCGHSFGSCQLTWLLHAPDIRHRIRQFVILDPVTILLSDPDVMINFLYTDTNSKIRMVAASELFTEYYLRRHFSWYNCELWLEDLPETTQVLVALSERDEIVNAPKVKEAIQMHSDELGVNEKDRLEVIYWKDVGHASCVTSPTKWKALKSKMLRQELALEQSKTKQSS
jgi:hypothetical protein